jgi:hypothetical protein
MNLTRIPSQVIISGQRVIKAWLALLLNEIISAFDTSSASLQLQIDNIASNGHYASGGPARLATAAALPANTYNNGAGTLTANGNGALSVDGSAVAPGDRILVIAEGAGAHNGLYAVTASGAVGAPYVLTRTSDANSSAELAAILVYIDQGATLAGDIYLLPLSVADIVIGTTALGFKTIFSSPKSIVGGLKITGDCTGLGVLRTEAQAVFSGPLGNGGISCEATGDTSAANESYLVLAGATPLAVGIQKLFSYSAKAVISGAGVYEGYGRLNPCYNLTANPADQLDSISCHLFKDCVVWGVTSDTSAIAARSPGNIVSAWGYSARADGAVIAGVFNSNFSTLNAAQSGGVVMGYASSDSAGIISPQGVSGRLAFWNHNGSAWGERFSLSANGHFMVGCVTEVMAGTAHHIMNTVIAEDAGNPILAIGSATTHISAFFNAVSLFGANAANAAVKFGKDGITGRSANLGGTVNASGADIAESYRKALLCGTILKGRLAGIDANGHLTDRWSEIAPGLPAKFKSTSPSLVGGDVWGSENALGLSLPIEPTPPAPPPGPGEPNYPQPPDPPLTLRPSENALYFKRKALYDARVAEINQNFKNLQSAHGEAMKSHADAMTAHKNEHAKYVGLKVIFAARLEEARAKHDRMAIKGKIPAVISGAVKVGDVVIPAKDGDGIIAVAVAGDPMVGLPRCAVGVVQVVNPSEARFKELLGGEWALSPKDPKFTIDPAWNTIVDV